MMDDARRTTMTTHHPHPHHHLTHTPHRPSRVPSTHTSISTDLLARYHIQFIFHGKVQLELQNNLPVHDTTEMNFQ